MDSSRLKEFNYCPNCGRRFHDNETACAICGIKKINTTNIGPKARWQKLLYIQQDYPDNYVDETFLEELQKNVNVHTYKYWTLVRETSVVSQHFSSMLIFIGIFIHLYNKNITENTLIFSSTTLLVILFLIWSSKMKDIDPRFIVNRLGMIKTGILLFAILLSFSPILKTLTEETSSDTIYALTVIFFIGNVILHDYGGKITKNIRFPESLSINLAIFASVLLASRLSSNKSVFGLLAFAVEWFALLPFFLRFLKKVSLTYFLISTVVFTIIAVLLFIPISKVVIITFCSVVFFVNFICPVWLISVQKYKNQINGPWDEAKMKVFVNKNQ
jgi:phosphatidylinositol glycan class C protein